ncbi:MAG: hypothetical protein OXP71_04465 [Candidatus Poribacteria bacterium]|nr:hypothetical protein [Candidatus Poribacteria bacterium]
MARTDKLKGCYRRVLGFLLIFGMLILAAGIFLYMRLGGVEGARYWMAGRAVDKVEEHLLKHRPDGVSEAEVRFQFESVRDANADRRANLVRLYRALKAYQQKFQSTKPSTGETIEFLGNLESAIAPTEKD